MNRSKLMLTLLLTGVLGVALTAPTGASADVGSCVFNDIVLVNADDPNDGGVQSVFTDLADGDTFDVDTGEYSFVGGAPLTSTCMLVDDASQDETNDSGLHGAAVSSHGRYANTVCGTGTFFDPLNSTSVGGLGNAAINNADLEMEFVSGSGTLTLSSFTNGDLETGSGSGVVNIDPWQNCVNEDAWVFDVHGAFVFTTN